LNLEGNKLGDKAAILILKSLVNEKQNLKILNLSKNNLSDSIADELNIALQNNYSINELYLHWNLLKSKAGCAIGNALIFNTNLKV
jgi:Ran GTPase-activating protein (RanGAP) involved in mRNA processing and transport